MTDLPGRDAPGRAADDRTPARELPGRRVRRPAAAGDAAPRESVFDDRIIEGCLPPPADERRVRPDGPELPGESIFGTVAVGIPLEPATAPEEIEFHPAAAAPRRWESLIALVRIPPRPAVLGGGALLVVCALLLFLLRGRFGAKPADEPEPPTPTVVAPVVVPPVPRQAGRRAPAKTSAAAPLKAPKETARAAAPALPAPPSPAERPTPARAEAPQVPAATAAPEPNLDEDGWFKLAEEYLQMGDETRAEALYRRILDGGTQKGRAALALGDLASRRNDFGRAQEYYRASKRLFLEQDRPTATP